PVAADCNRSDVSRAATAVFPDRRAFSSDASDGLERSARGACHDRGNRAMDVLRPSRATPALVVLGPGSGDLAHGVGSRLPGIASPARRVVHHEMGGCRVDCETAGYDRNRLERMGTTAKMDTLVLEHECSGQHAGDPLHAG